MAVGLVRNTLAKQPKGIHVLHFWKLSMAYVLAMFFSNAALAFINYPTQVLAKSVKMIPVMVMAAIFLKRRYAKRDYAVVLVITLGISSFFLKRIPEHALQSSDLSGLVSDPVAWLSAFDVDYMKGLGLVLLSLTADGAVGVLQDGLLHRSKPSDVQMMLYMNLWSVIYLGGALLATGQGAEAVAFCVQHPAVLKDILLFSLCSAAGQVFIFHTVQHFQALVTSMITTTRKFFTILASVFYYNHPLTPLQWFGVSAVFAGLLGNVYIKYQKSKEASAGRKEMVDKSKKQR